MILYYTVVIKYHQAIKRKVIFDGKVLYYSEPGDFDSKKQATAFAANFTHSLDALLVYYFSLLLASINSTISVFFVHDSFVVPTLLVPFLKVQLRNIYVDVFFNFGEFLLQDQPPMFKKKEFLLHAYLCYFIDNIENNIEKLIKSYNERHEKKITLEAAQSAILKARSEIDKFFSIHKATLERILTLHIEELITGKFSK